MNRRAMSSICVGLAALASVALAGPAAAVCPSTSVSVYDGALSNAQIEQSLFCQINRARKKAKLKLLKREANLDQAARAHSEDMAQNDYFDHTGRDGSDFSERVGRTAYTGSLRSEIIASGYSTPKDTFSGWMHSPPHRSAILDKSARLIGLGAAVISGNARYTGVFGRR